ncbi:MAG: hypothetical protein EBX37_00200 [Alphaproteobacteria bacterium]|nr:hypothetical protein [Alphaproteobacteria bacterium]
MLRAPYGSVGRCEEGNAMRFELPSLPGGSAGLRAELRAFLAEAGRDWSPAVRARSWMGFDRDFSRELGARGWIGMVWPKAYGGHERSGLERVVVLEEYEHAKARGATIYAEVAGYGMSGDAHHITAPSDTGDGAFRSMRMALRDAGVTPDQVQYVNAHGTSTPMGDDLELGAVERLWGEAGAKLAMSSTKSSVGHLLGAAGAVEAVFSIQAIRDGVAPPTLNLENPSRESIIDRVALQAQQRPIEYALSNSFGFGGTNASVVFRRAP